MNVNQKELILLPYPFSNLEEKKIRPALVVSNNSFNNKSADCLAVPLTSVIKDVSYSILINQEDLKAGKLLKPSRVRTDKIFAVEKDLIVMKIGLINDKTFDNIKKEIFRMF